MWTLLTDSLVPMGVALAIGIATGWWLTRRPAAAPAPAPAGDTEG